MKKKLLFSIVTLTVLSACGSQNTQRLVAEKLSKKQLSTASNKILPNMRATYFPSKAEKNQNKLAAQITEGQLSERGARPYQAALISLSGKQFCGGTLLSPEWVLTAAHCIGNFEFEVRVGANRLSDASQGVSHAVASRHVHPKYTEAVYGYDIALLKLEKPVVVDKYTQMAYLPTDRVESVLDVAGHRAIVSGWGDLYAGAREGSDDLYEIEIPITPNPSKCGNNHVPDNMICGHVEQNKDSCQGDSGGPLAQKLNGRFYVLGVVSFGIGCSGNGLYTRVNAYLDWIKQTSRLEISETGGLDTVAPVRGRVEYKADMKEGYQTYAPSEKGFAYAGGMLVGNLEGPQGTDFDLYLERQDAKGQWTAVVSSVNENSSEHLNYKATKGIYRWSTVSFKGSGKAILEERKNIEDVDINPDDTNTDTPAEKPVPIEVK